MPRLRAFCLVLVAGSPCWAQDTIPVDRLKDLSAVRITAPSLSPRPVQGRVISTDSSGVVIVARDATVRILQGDIASLQRPIRGSRGNSALLWGLVGAVSGFVAVNAGLNMQYQNDENNGLYAWLYGVPGGAVVGGLLGAMIPRPRWVELKIREWL